MEIDEIEEADVKFNSEQLIPGEMKQTTKKEIQDKEPKKSYYYTQNKPKKINLELYGRSFQISILLSFAIVSSLQEKAKCEDRKSHQIRIHQLKLDWESKDSTSSKHYVCENGRSALK